jgi:undecaprenyl-diphosphatase
LKPLIKYFQKWDSSLCLTIFNWNGRKILDRIMSFASKFGNGYAYPVFGLFISIFDSSVFGKIFPAGVASFAVEHTAYKLVKTRIKRLRPSEVIPQIRNLVSFPDRFSFPSGHTAGAFLMATLIRHFYPGIDIPLYTAASVIGVSRIYNGVHYPSDVAAGTVLGIASAKVGIFIAG